MKSDSRKKKVIKEAKRYIQRYQYVHLKWFVRKKLRLSVQDSFIISVAISMTKNNRYILQETSKNDLRIYKNSTFYISFFLKYILSPFIIGLVLFFLGRWLSK